MIVLEQNLLHVCVQLAVATLLIFDVRQKQVTYPFVFFFAALDYHDHRDHHEDLGLSVLDHLAELVVLLAQTLS